MELDDLEAAFDHICREDDGPERDASHPSCHHRPASSYLVFGLARGGQRLEGLMHVMR